jgi:hypothetical protein
MWRIVHVTQKSPSKNSKAKIFVEKNFSAYLFWLVPEPEVGLFGEGTEATPEILQFLFSQAGTLWGYQVLKKNIPFETLGILESSMNELSVTKKKIRVTVSNQPYEEFSSEKG